MGKGKGNHLFQAQILSQQDLLDNHIKKIWHAHIFEPNQCFVMKAWNGKAIDIDNNLNYTHKEG